MEITKREILVSIGILAIMIIIGLFIDDKIAEYVLDDNEQYYKALQIDSENIFRYSMDTNIGNAFVHGKLEAVEPVNYQEIDGQYLYVKKIKEEHRMHTKTVTSVVNGKSRTRTKTYWSWDQVDSEYKQADKVKLLNQEFPTSQFNIPTGSYISTINESSKVRYKYFGYPANSTVTIFANLQNGNIANNNIDIYQDLSINQVIKQLEKNQHITFIFWIVWLVLTGAIIYYFCEDKNSWLY